MQVVLDLGARRGVERELSDEDLRKLVAMKADDELARRREQTG